MTTDVRIDKWLWAVRIYKTRALATDACKANRITVNGSPVKPSREVKIGDIIAVRKPPVTFTHRVLELVNNRQPAKDVPRYMEDITPQSEKDKLKQNITIFVSRDRGTGRPTKKERREIDQLMDDFDYGDAESFEDFE